MDSDNAQYPIYNYRDIFLKYFFLDKKGKRLACPEYVLIFVLAGKLTVSNKNYNATAQKGEYIFLRKDIKTKLIREPFDSESFSSIFMGFNTNFLRDFYHNMDKEKIPHHADNFKENIIKPTQNACMESLYISMLSYIKWNIRPIKQILGIRLIEAIFCLLSTDKSFYSCLFNFSTSQESYIKEIPNRLKCECYNAFNFPQYTINREIQTTYIEIQKGAEITDIYMEASWRNIRWFIREYTEHYDPKQFN